MLGQRAVQSPSRKRQKFASHFLAVFQCGLTYFLIIIVGQRSTIQDVVLLAPGTERVVFAIKIAFLILLSSIEQAKQ